MTISIWQHVLNERNQAYQLRKRLFSKISKCFEKRYVISFYTKFGSNVTIDAGDSQMLSNMLSGSQRVKNDKILLIINSPGGDPLASEKIIKILSEYSDNDYWVLVPEIAKSAATVICLGASKMILTPTSELGPIDLQVVKEDRLIPAYSIIRAYDKLMEQGVNLGTKQRIEPILQQLQDFNPSEIEVYRQINELSSDIAIKALEKGMLKKMNKAQIKKMIKIFLDPAQSKIHGRPIFFSDIKEIDKEGHFKLELLNTDDDIWQHIIEYHMRVTNHMTAAQTQKLLESDEGSFRA